MSCKKNAKRAATFFRITDEYGRISLTNITMMIVMYKIAVTPSMGMQDITALAIGVLGYQVKRMVSK